MNSIEWFKAKVQNLFSGDLSKALSLTMKDGKEINHKPEQQFSTQRNR